MKLYKNLPQEARLALHGRILRCPLGGNPPDCPLHGIRKLPLEDRIAWLESRTDDETIDLYQLHKKCLQCKLEDYETQLTGSAPDVPLTSED